MKKTPVVSFIVIIGLLILCVTTLVAIYATGSESVILLLDEKFERLNESKWSHEILDCEENGKQFHYVTATEENGMIANGTLHIYPNLTEVHFKTKRDVERNCYYCINSDNSTCVPSKFSTRLRTKNVFEADRGRIEIRAKLCYGGEIKFNIGIILCQNDSNSEVLERFLVSENGTKNNSSEVRIFYKSASKQTVIRSAVTQCEFHIYEISWSEEKISVRIDNQNVIENKIEKSQSEEKSNSNATEKPDSEPQFYLNISVDFEENVFEHTESKQPLNILKDLKNNNLEILEVDYIKIFKILN